jgi:hypothetical protein
MPKKTKPPTTKTKGAKNDATNGKSNGAAKGPIVPLEESEALSVKGLEAFRKERRRLENEDIQPQTRHLECILTDEECDAKRIESSLLTGRRSKLEEEAERLKAHAKELTKQADGLDSQAKALVAVAEAGREYRDIGCVEIFDPDFVHAGEKGAQISLRLDTEEILAKRRANAAVRQGNLFDGSGGAGAGGNGEGGNGEGDHHDDDQPDEAAPAG